MKLINTIFIFFGVITVAVAAIGSIDEAQQNTDVVPELQVSIFIYGCLSRCFCCSFVKPSSFVYKLQKVTVAGTNGYARTRSSVHGRFVR